jgi:hypothetical protein
VTLPQPRHRGPMIRQSFYDFALCLVLRAFWYVSGFFD